jgi:hypothetical protein
MGLMEAYGSVYNGGNEIGIGKNGNTATRSV